MSVIDHIPTLHTISGFDLLSTSSQAQNRPWIHSSGSWQWSSYDGYTLHHWKCFVKTCGMSLELRHLLWIHTITPIRKSIRRKCPTVPNVLSFNCQLKKHPKAKEKNYCKDDFSKITTILIRLYVSIEQKLGNCIKGSLQNQCKSKNTSMLECYPIARLRLSPHGPRPTTRSIYPQEMWNLQKFILMTHFVEYIF